MRGRGSARGAPAVEGVKPRVSALVKSSCVAEMPRLRLAPFHHALCGARRPSPAMQGRKVSAQISFAIARAVSLMRVEKPHSLSYQDSTRPSWPSITWVCGRAAVE